MKPTGESRLKTPPSKRLLLEAAASVAALVVTGTFIAGGGLSWFGPHGNQYAPLPGGCVKPANGYLLFTTDLGWNNSLQHGPTLYPVISVNQGQNVTIVVCNVDTQSHGFQINYYDDKQIVSDNPGKVIRVSFIASKAGSFAIYCDIFCTIHPEMIGQLRVTAA